MSNMYTSQASGGRDFSYAAYGYTEDEFHELYNEIISKLSELSLILDETKFKSELHKLRSKMNRLINRHFNTVLSKILTSQQHEYCQKQIQTKIKKPSI